MASTPTDPTWPKLQPHQRGSRTETQEPNYTLSLLSQLRVDQYLLEWGLPPLLRPVPKDFKAHRA